MKIILLLWLFPLVFFAGTIQSNISVEGDPLVAFRTITQGFYSVEYKLENESFEQSGEVLKWRAKAIGNKGLNLVQLGEYFKEQGFIITRIELSKGELYLDLNGYNAHWNIAELGQDEATEIKKVSNPQWFRVRGSQIIRLESPYTTKWYPDIAILDEQMNLVSSLRSHEEKDELEFELPKEAYYLKVSHSQGMKLLKEGMWVESKSLGR